MQGRASKAMQIDMRRWPARTEHLVSRREALLEHAVDLLPAAVANHHQLEFRLGVD